MTDKFTDSMEVAEVGDLRPSSIGGDCCRDCWNDTRVMQGVLIEGVTKDAVMLLSEKVEIVPEGTKARLEKLEDSNREMLEALEDCCVIAKPENPACCCPNYQPLPDGDCAEAKNGDCHIWKAIRKERGQG